MFQKLAFSSLSLVPFLMLLRFPFVRTFSVGQRPSSAQKFASLASRWSSSKPHLRLFSSSTAVDPVTSSAKTFETTPLGTNGRHLLDGLDLYSVPADGDGHPLAVYGIDSQQHENNNKEDDRPVILLLHGRTWSSVPVYHLFGGPRHEQAGDESRSLMQALLDNGLQPYCMDFRGFGGTAQDDTGHVEPLRCVRDAETVLQWLAEKHSGCSSIPSLLGWSQGALVGQLLAQNSPQLFSRLILYGSIYDPLYRYARKPIYRNSTSAATNPIEHPVLNTFDSAIEDFTIQGTIPHETACYFAHAALLSDPVKAEWKHLYQFNNCDPARIHSPTLVVAGDQDPYAPLHVQQELFCNLGRGSDRMWSILADADHAVHMLEGRERLTNAIVSFVKSGKRNEH